MPAVNFRSRLINAKYSCCTTSVVLASTFCPSFCTIKCFTKWFRSKSTFMKVLFFFLSLFKPKYESDSIIGHISFYSWPQSATFSSGGSYCIRLCGHCQYRFWNWTLLLYSSQVRQPAHCVLLQIVQSVFILCNLICSLRIEVADFDFEEEDVGNPESFSGRLRSSIVQYWSGLKGQTPPANTSYQNITFDWVRNRLLVFFSFFFFW